MIKFSLQIFISLLFITHIDLQAQDTIISQNFEYDHTQQWGFSKNCGEEYLFQSNEKQYEGEYSLKFKGSRSLNIDPTITFEDLIFPQPYKYARVVLPWACYGPDSQDNFCFDYLLNPDEPNFSTLHLLKGFNSVKIDFGQMPNNLYMTDFDTNPAIMHFTGDISFFRMKIRFDERSISSNSGDAYYLDKVEFHGYFLPPPPLNLDLTPLNTYEIEVDAQQNDFGHTIIIIVNDSNNWEEVDIVNPNIAVGDEMGGGQIVYIGNGDYPTIYSASEEGQTLFFKAFSYDNDVVGDCVIGEVSCYKPAPTYNVDKLSISEEADRLNIIKRTNYEEEIPDGYILQLRYDNNFSKLINGKTYSEQIIFSEGEEGFCDISSYPFSFVWPGLESCRNYLLKVTPYNNFDEQIRYGNGQVFPVRTLSYETNSKDNPFSVFKSLTIDVEDSFFISGYLLPSPKSTPLFLCDSPYLKDKLFTLPLISTTNTALINDLNASINTSRKILLKVKMVKDDEGLLLDVLSCQGWLDQTTFWTGKTSDEWTNILNWEPCIPHSKADAIIESQGEEINLVIPEDHLVSSFNIRSSYCSPPQIRSAYSLDMGIPVIYDYLVSGYNDNPINWLYIGPIGNNLEIENSCFMPEETTDLYDWYEKQNMWLNYKDENDPFDSLKLGKGYLYSVPDTQELCFSAALNTKPILYHDLTIEEGQGWHLLSNPYCHDLVWGSEQVQLDGINPHCYKWDTCSGNYNVSSEKEKIFPGAGFFIKVEKSVNSISFFPLCQSLVDNTIMKEKDSFFSIFVQNIENSYSDYLQFFYVEDGSFIYDQNKDAPKLYGYSLAPQIYSRSSDKKHLSVDYLPIANMELPIYMELVEGKYILKSNWKSEQLEFVIRDNLTGLLYDQEHFDPISFEVKDYFSGARFSLIVKRYVGTAVMNQKLIKPLLYTYQSEIHLFANDDEIHNGVLKVFDCVGRQVFSKILSFKKCIVQPVVLQKGLYIGVYEEKGCLISTKFMF